jgi:hypothetical protein
MTQIVLDRIADSRSQDAASAPVSRGAAPRALDRSNPWPLQKQRPARGSGRAAGPVLRPVVACPPPAAGRGAVRRARACSLPAPGLTAARVSSISSAPTWRLTERGVAVVLVVGLMIMVAALTVVGLTAAKVTGAGYQATVSASMPR